MTAFTPALARRRRRRWRRGLALAAVAVLATTTTTFWLADSGTVSLPASVAPTPSGTSSTGTLASFAPFTPSLVVPSRSGSSVPGMALGRVTVAAGYASNLKVDVAWLDPQDAGKVLNNKNAWLSFGLYAPIHSGSCANESNAVTITDGSTYCTQLISVAGKLVSGDTLTIGQTLLSGYMVVGASDPSSPQTCDANTSSWCAPSGLGLSNQNVFYVVATVYNAGGNPPPGQQDESGTLQFYIDAHGTA